MDEFLKEAFMQSSDKATSENVVIVDRYARELRTYWLYNQHDKINGRQLSQEEIQNLHQELKRAEKWVEENQHKLTGL